MAVGFAVVMTTYPMRRYGYTNLEATLYNCTNKIGWSLALFWVVFSCIQGKGGLINSFLSWGAFTVLGRLTYFAYLNHIPILVTFYFALDYTVYFSNFQIVSWSYKVCNRLDKNIDLWIFSQFITWLFLF